MITLKVLFEKFINVQDFTANQYHMDITENTHTNNIQTEHVVFIFGKKHT